MVNIKQQEKIQVFPIQHIKILVERHTTELTKRGSNT
jgi:hypothetical protein